MRHKIILTVWALVSIPLVLFGAAKWLEFWINRTFGEWMACGLGIPVAIAVAVMAIWKLDRLKDAEEGK